MSSPADAETIGAVSPIDARQREQVVERTHQRIRQAGAMFNIALPIIPVTFDLVGATAGMYQLRDGERRIRFNPYIFAKYFDDNLNTTVAHEVAHYIVDIVYGIRRVRAHGAEWRAVMHSFGANDSARCHYDLSGIPRRCQKRHSYACACNVYQLTSRRHNAVQQHRCSYVCRTCGTALKYCQEDSST